VFYLHAAYFHTCDKLLSAIKSRVIGKLNVISYYFIYYFQCFVTFSDESDDLAQYRLPQLAEESVPANGTSVYVA
jgi:hypothetical protein